MVGAASIEVVLPRRDVGYDKERAHREQHDDDKREWAAGSG